MYGRQTNDSFISLFLICLVVSILISIASCNQPHHHIEYYSYDEMVAEYDRLTTDNEATWKQIISFANTFADTLAVRAADVEQVRNRILAQHNGYMLISLIMDKYDEYTETGKEASYDDIPPLLDKINDFINLWFYDVDEEVPYLWRDHYYVCHQNGNEPVHGFFHIMVTLPCEELPEPTLHVGYPYAAEEDPVLIFTKFLQDGSGNEDTESWDTVVPEKWKEKDEEEGMPMYALFSSDTVEKLLNNDILYLMFKSGASPEGDPAEQEIARISLASLHGKWKEVNTD